MTTINRILNNNIYLVARVVITAFFSIITTRLILDSLGVEDFGIYSLFLAIVGIFGILSSSITGTSQRFLLKALGEKNIELFYKTFNVSLVLHFLIGLFLVLLMLLCKSFILSNINIISSKFLAIDVLYSYMIIHVFSTVMFSLLEAALFSLENFMTLGVLGIFESFVKFLFALYIASNQDSGLLVLGLYSALIPLISLIFLIFYGARKINLKLISFNNFDKKLIIPMMAMLGWNLFGSISILFGQHGNAVVLNRYHGAALNSSYSVAQQFLGQLAVLSGTVRKAFTPAIVKSYSFDSKGAYSRYVFVGTKLIFFSISFFYLPMIFNANFILDLWLVAVPPHTLEFINLIIYTVLVEHLFLFLPILIYAHGDTKYFEIGNGIFSMLQFVSVVTMFSFGYEPKSFLYVALFVSILRVFYTFFIAVKLSIVDFVEFLKVVIFPSSFGFMIGVGSSYIIHYFFNGFFELFLSSLLYLIVFIIVTLNKIERAIIRSSISQYKSKFMAIFFNKYKL